MKLNITILVAALLTAGLTVGCGDPAPGEVQPPPYNANTPDVGIPDATEPDAAEPDAAEPDAAEPDAAEPDAAEPDAAEPDAAEPDASQPDETLADRVDVWVDTLTRADSEPTPIEVGQDFGGQLPSPGVHVFAMELNGGEGIELSTIELEPRAANPDETQLYVMVTYPDTQRRVFLPRNADKRQFFAVEAGTYLITVGGPGGPGAGFAFNTSPAELTPTAITAPSTQNGDLNDGSLAVYSVTFDEAVPFRAEVFADRAPVSSSLDSVLFVWDVTRDALVAQNDDIFYAGTYDSAIDRTLLEPGEYLFIIDMYKNVADARFEFEMSLPASSRISPIALEVDGTYEGTIVERRAGFYSDFFAVTVNPGTYIKVKVEGSDQLEPLIYAFDPTTAGNYIDGTALPVGNDAGITLGPPSDADGARTYLLQLTDQRNLRTESAEPTFVGGDAFGYTISVSNVTGEIPEIRRGSPIDVSLADVGDTALFNLSAPDGYLIWLMAGDDIGLLDDYSNVDDFDFIPSIGLTEGSTLSMIRPTSGLYWATGTTTTFQVRDLFFRGGLSGFATPMSLEAFDVMGELYDEYPLDGGNTTPLTATQTLKSFKVEGTFATREIPSLFETPARYYSVTMPAGSTFAAVTENSAGLETRLTLMAFDGTTAAKSEYLMKQFQTAAAGENYWDSALVYRSAVDGQFILKVEPRCEELRQPTLGFDGYYCETGDTIVRATFQ